MARRRRRRRPIRCISSPASRATGCTARWMPARSARAARSRAARRSRSIRPTRSARGIDDGDVVRVLQCARRVPRRRRLSATRSSPGVVKLSCGAWYDPAGAERGALCAHGNANVLTRDQGTSKLARGRAPAPLVEVERWTGPLPPVRAFEPPQIAASA